MMTRVLKVNPEQGVEFVFLHHRNWSLLQTRSLGALRALTSTWRPFGPLDCDRVTNAKLTCDACICDASICDACINDGCIHDA